MTRVQLLCAVLAVLAVVVILATAVPRARQNNDNLTGLWAGTPEFLGEADLSKMYFSLAPPEGRSRWGYLLMLGLDGEEVSAQTFELSWDAPAKRFVGAVGEHFGGEPRAYRATIAYDHDAVMPEELEIVHDAAAGTLVLRDGEKLYAHLVRDNEASLN